MTEDVSYRDCGSCSAPDAAVKCTCQLTHYCDIECQRKDMNSHRKSCTYLLNKDISTLCRELQELKVQHNCSAHDVSATEDELAGLHSVVGRLHVNSLLASNYPFVENHHKQALKIYRRLAARDSTEASHIVNSVIALMDLGFLYSAWQRECRALEAYENALGSLRDVMSAHGSTLLRQETLAELLANQGEVYKQQYEDQGSGPDKSKCHAAQALGEEALAIHRTLNALADELALDNTAEPQQTLKQDHRQERTASVLLLVARTYENLDIFDEARSAVREALELRSLCHGNENVKVADCYGEMGTICSLQGVLVANLMLLTLHC